MTIFQTLFSFEGAIGRARYALFHLPIIFLNIGLSQVLRHSHLDQGAAAMFSALSLVLIYISFSLMIKRLHDIGQSGWVSLLALVPVANLLLLLYLLFKAGKSTQDDSNIIDY